MAEDPSQLSESDDSSKFDILGIGMSMMDTIQRVEEFPVTTGVTEVSESAIMGGGPVPTALCSAAQLGSRVAILDRVGDDWRGDLIQKDYRRYGVDTRYLQLEEGCTSSLGIVLVRQRDGERHILFQRGNFSELETEELRDELLENCRVLHLNGRHWPACLEAARRVKRSGGITSFDGGAHRYDLKFEPLLKEIDILIVARDFAKRLAESEDHEIQLRELLRRGADIVGITDGVRGSWFQTKSGESFHQCAFPVEPVIDTTGCGDVFHGAFLSAHCRGEDWKSCARFASAAAAINATELGGRGNLASFDEVSRWLEARAGMSEPGESGEPFD